MSARDLTEALDKLTQPTSSGAPDAPKLRGEAPVVKSSALIAGGAGGGAGATFTATGAMTIITSDGLFAISFPETLETNYGADVMTLGVIKKVTP